MRNKTVVLALLLMAGSVLWAGCTAVNDVMTPSSPPGGGTPIANMDQPTNGDTLGNGATEHADGLAPR